MVFVRCLLTCFYALLLFPLLAQKPAQPIRLELPFDLETTTAEVIALPDSSLLVYHKTSDLWRAAASFNLSKYDARLEPVWSDTVSLFPDSEYLRSFIEAPYTYMIFGEDDLQMYTVVRVHNGTGQTQHKRYELDQLEAVYEFVVLQGNYFIIGHGRKENKPALLHLNTRTDEVQLLPSVYGDRSTFSDLLAGPAAFSRRYRPALPVI